MIPAPAETLTLLPESTPVLRFVYTFNVGMSITESSRLRILMIRNLFLILPIRNEKKQKHINAMQLRLLSWRINSINTVTHLH